MASPRSPALSGVFTPPFVVGVTGHMDIDLTYRDRIRAEVKRVFTWLRASPDDYDEKRDSYALGPGLNLKRTPIVLLSSLAPGADQWVAEVAQEMSPPIQVLAPLPFLKDQYLEASTFKAGGVTKDDHAIDFLVHFPIKNLFVVRTPEELDLDDDALRAKHKFMLGGLSGQAERNRRYLAAGAYVAAHSNLLISLTEKPVGQRENTLSALGEQPGARAITELKRRGITPTPLPLIPAATWADSGPVIHIYSPRSSKPPYDPVPAEEQAWPLEVLYPYDCRPPEVSEEENHHPEWLRAGHAILKVTTERLERLNSEKVRTDPDRENSALVEMLPAVGGSSTTGSTHALPGASESLKTTLDRLARLRRRMADLSSHYNAHLTELKQALFCLAFSSALFFSLADNWDVKTSILPLSQIFFLIALALILATWLTYFYFKRTAASERCDDYRAIAEGLRVQFYWTASGSGELVASNYLQRQRGELGWIRNVINVAALPFEPNRVDFNQLHPAEQRAALQSIRKTWIGGQYFYFRNKLDDLSRRRDAFTRGAHVLLWTGFSLATFLFFVAKHARSAAFPPLFDLLVCVLGVMVLVTLSRRSAGSTSSEHHRKEGTGNSGKPRQIVVNGLLVLALSLMILGLCYFLASVVPWLPSAKSLGGIFKNLAFVGGVLCAAWIDVNFFAENIRHYASMISLFQTAGLRFDDYLIWAQRTDRDVNAAANQTIANIQSLIVSVGREALSENAEWLIIHRARPIEPVSV
jgi:hypothetical protein